jgi:hypothetical protein
MPLYVVRTLGAPAYALGLVYASEGAGALFGAALACPCGKKPAR